MGKEVTVNNCTRRIGSSMAWFAKGPALERYNDVIRPEILRILRHTKPPEGEDLFIKLYIIGRNEEKANPMVMICCYDKKTRDDAQDLVRESGLLDEDENSGFGLGSNKFPLETDGVPRNLGNDELQFPTTTSNTQARQSQQMIEVFGVSRPGIGRKLAFYQQGTMAQYATGGPIIRLGEDVYQLTVAHAMCKTSVEEVLPVDNSDLDDCNFDGQSDTEEDSVSHMVLSRGSMSEPEDTTSDADLAQDLQQSASLSSSGSPDEFESFEPQRRTIPDPGRRTDAAEHQASPEHISNTLLSTFPISSYEAIGLDYCLVKLPEEEWTTSSYNAHLEGTFALGSGSAGIEVADIATVSGSNIDITVMANRGPISGVLLPDSTSLKTSGQIAIRFKQ
ncbi:hypothetical protein N0V82_003258 [Gnomoniopsis sp. IMI 355080]|nr:hypothetical protein N0V82_003258 [Gnomoniopsis sp. IMI 355080]